MEAGTHGRAIDNDRAGAAQRRARSRHGFRWSRRMVAQVIRERQAAQLHFDLSNVDTNSHCHGELLTELARPRA